jgi:hypothetical protein
MTASGHPTAGEFRPKADSQPSCYTLWDVY